MSKERAEQYKNDYYPDNLTKITDPFWLIQCQECGKVFYSVTFTGNCPGCGCEDGITTLSGKSLEDVVLERKNKSLSEFIRENHIKS